MRFEDIPGCYSLGRLKIFKETASDATRDRKPRSIIKKIFIRSKKVDTTSETSDSEEDCCWVCTDAVEDMLEATSKTVTYLDIMRDKVPVGSRAYIYLCIDFFGQYPAQLDIFGILASQL